MDPQPTSTGTVGVVVCDTPKAPRDSHRAQGIKYIAKVKNLFSGKSGRSKTTGPVNEHFERCDTQSSGTATLITQKGEPDDHSCPPPLDDRAAGDQIYIHNDRSDTLIGEIHNENGEHFALCSPVSTSGGSIINSKDDKHQAESCNNEATKPLTSNESQNDTGTTDLAAENVFDPRSAEIKHIHCEGGLLMVVAPISVFVASINATLIAFARDLFNEHNAGGSLAPVSEQVIYACFYVAMLLSLFAGAFAWIMHADTLSLVWGAERVPGLTHHIPAATKSGSMFWTVSFILPAMFLTFVGLEVLVWSASTIAVGVFVTLGSLYGLYQLYRAILRVSRANPRNTPSDPEKGIGDTCSM